jgi:hypothetical protein
MHVANGKKSSIMPLDRISNFITSARYKVKGLPIIMSVKALAGEPDAEVSICCEDVGSNDASTMNQQKWLEKIGFKRLVVTFKGMIRSHRNPPSRKPSSADMPTPETERLGLSGGFFPP